MDDDPSPLLSDAADLKRLWLTMEAEDAERLHVPDDLWARIEAEVDSAEPATRSTTGVSVAPPTRVVVPIRRGRVVRVGAALAVAASVAAAVWMVGSRGDDGRELASVALTNEGLAAFAVVPSGSVRLIDDHGRLFLDVELVDSPDIDENYIELWMIDRGVSGMVSLGPYHGDDRYEVPPGVDPASFPVVDVSIEPVDGVPTHSGVSIVRGVLPT